MKNLKIALIVALLCFAGCAITLKASSQAFVGFEASNHGGGVNIGGIISNVQLKAGFIHTLSNKAYVPNIFYGQAGYQINLTNNEGDNFSFTPSAGIADYRSGKKSGDDLIEIQKTALLTSLELGKDFTVQQNGNEGRYYVFINHAVEVFVGIGLKVFIE